MEMQFKKKKKNCLGTYSPKCYLRQIFQRHPVLLGILLMSPGAMASELHQLCITEPVMDTLSH